MPGIGRLVEKYAAKGGRLSLAKLRHLASRLAFTLGARFYAWQTWHEVWRQHCGSLAAHFPPPLPSGRLCARPGIGPGVSGIGIRQRRPDLWLVGLDFSADMLDLARHYLRISNHGFPLVHGDVTHLPFADECFDVITHHSFLYLLGNRDAGLKKWPAC